MNSQSALSNPYEHGPSCNRLHNMDETNPQEQVQESYTSNVQSISTNIAERQAEPVTGAHHNDHTRNEEQPVQPNYGEYYRDTEMSNEQPNYSGYTQATSFPQQQDHSVHNRPLTWFRSATTEPSMRYTVESDKWILELLTLLRKIDPVHEENFKRHLYYLQKFALSINSAHDSAIESLVRSKRVVRKMKEVLNLYGID